MMVSRQATAGRPMLDVILGEDIYNVAAVVTRYFGGILLGTGGLVRAYSRSLQEGLPPDTVIRETTEFYGSSYGLYRDRQDPVYCRRTEITESLILNTLTGRFCICWFRRIRLHL